MIKAASKDSSKQSASKRKIFMLPTANILGIFSKTTTRCNVKYHSHRSTKTRRRKRKTKLIKKKRVIDKLKRYL
jgi:hypothetical protein